MTAGQRTPLQRQLDRDLPQRATPLDALHSALRWFHRGQRLDMTALAAELGVSRVTLHRWVGARERLLVEVLWTATDRAISALEHRWASFSTPEVDEQASKTADVLAAWTVGVLAHPGVRQLQVEENDLFVRLTTRDASEYQRRLIQRVAELLRSDLDANCLTIDLEPDDLAYTTVRIAESFIHTRAITGDDPDPARAERVLHAFLR